MVVYGPLGGTVICGYSGTLMAACSALGMFCFRYYKAADWVVTASDFETFGNMTHEANL